jgi:hypothetical protein
MAKRQGSGIEDVPYGRTLDYARPRAGEPGLKFTHPSELLQGSGLDPSEIDYRPAGGGLNFAPGGAVNIRPNKASTRDYRKGRVK